MAKRFQTWFGVPLPPWRDRKLGAGAITIRFVVKGRVPSKKNNQQAVCERRQAVDFLDDIARSGRPITLPEAKAALKKVRAKMRGNDQYKQFLEDHRSEIIRQRQFWLDRLHSKGLIFPLSSGSLSIRFYFSQRYHQDSVNKQQSIQDLLKDCLVIADDDYTCLNPITVDADCFYEEIRENITAIALTFQPPK